MKKYKVDYLPIQPVTEEMPVDIANGRREINRAILADGFKGHRCLLAQNLMGDMATCVASLNTLGVDKDACEQIASVVDSEHHLSGFEQYDNGFNVFVRNRIEHTQVAVIKLMEAK